MLEKFKIGHDTQTEAGTGVTVILAEEGATAGVSTRGASPSTRETDLLRDGKRIRRIHAIVLSGGSSFGLEAACGVAQLLHERSVGHRAGQSSIVPLVAGASLFDLEYRQFAFPDKAAGYRAASAARVNAFDETGSIGAGTGATISKVMGREHAVKAGIGIALYAADGLEIAVIVAVNAVGDIVKNGEIIAGAKHANGEFVDCRHVFANSPLVLGHENTTIGCVLTNAALSKEECNVLADLAHDGLALAISPAHSPYDGDTFFALASGEKDEIGLMPFVGLVAPLTAKAIQSAVPG
ncbi:MAG: P1 family peptidase [Betaproteobacteria bacterium]|nr:P1 family peptidase [Betaproteobacteria bacterium]